MHDQCGACYSRSVIARIMRKAVHPVLNAATGTMAAPSP
jgi:hypothetical protein